MELIRDSETVISLFPMGDQWAHYLEQQKHAWGSFLVLVVSEGIRIV